MRIQMSNFDRPGRALLLAGRLFSSALRHAIYPRKPAARSASAANGGLPFARAALIRANIIAVAFLAFQSPAYPGFLLDGSRDNLEVKADQAPLSDIIGALGRKFDVRLKSQVALDVRVDGYFSGSLTSVLRRLLEPYNFVFALGQNGDVNSIVVIVLGQANNADLSHVTLQPIRPPQVRHDDGGG